MDALARCVPSGCNIGRDVFAPHESSMGSGVVVGCGLHAIPSHTNSALTNFLSIHVAVALEKASWHSEQACFCAKEPALLS